METEGNSAPRGGFEPTTSCHAGIYVLTVRPAGLPDATILSTSI